ncbi:MAG: tRNA (guanosine(46)-N7)-methyltransferase TrmB [Acholeplasma sp.]|nr:tRNA (guanosine(46)-N7)-methyltransferase TrmB [Acholeplasma sp.]
MRQKRLKNVDKELMQKLDVVTDVTKIVFDYKYRKIHLEIGSGKGNFITKMANAFPDELFIAIEKNINVCYRIVEKRDDIKLNNLIIILGDSNELLEYLDNKSVDNIYLNFSDPWPKKKHHKRRLTYGTFLKKYKKVLKENGVIQFRTDHFDLFNDSIEYFKDEFVEVEPDFDYRGNEFYTEYEEKKRKIGKIYQCKVSGFNEKIV